jgi:hypothetical protein
MLRRDYTFHLDNLLHFICVPVRRKPVRVHTHDSSTSQYFATYSCVPAGQGQFCVDWILNNPSVALHCTANMHLANITDISYQCSGRARNWVHTRCRGGQ